MANYRGGECPCCGHNSNSNAVTTVSDSDNDEDTDSDEEFYFDPTVFDESRRNYLRDDDHDNHPNGNMIMV